MPFAARYVMLVTGTGRGFYAILVRAANPDGDAAQQNSFTKILQLDAEMSGIAGLKC
jgi:hypothetical protein